MKAGQTEFFDLPSGSTSTQYQLDYLGTDRLLRRGSARQPAGAGRRRPVLFARPCPSVSSPPASRTAPASTCIVEGLPAGLELSQDDLNRDMARRQLGHGRGGRMKIEKDTAEVTAGVRHGQTLGGPIALQVANRDYANWEERMNPWPVEAEVPEVHLPRPGHADLVGTDEVRHLGRAQRPRAGQRRARRRHASPAAAWPRRSCGAVGVEVFSHVIQITGGPGAGPLRSRRRPTSPAVDDSPVRCLDPETSAAMVAEINRLRKANESLGGVFEVRAFGLDARASAPTSRGRSASTAAWPRPSSRSRR